MLQPDSQLFQHAGPPGRSDRSRRIADAILSDCKRPDWVPADLAGTLEGVYHSEGPAVAAEIWRLLKSLVAEHSRAKRKTPMVEVWV